MIKLTPTHLEFLDEHKNIFSPGDIVTIQYNQQGENIFPIIGLDTYIKGDPVYKVTKNNTILLKGKNNNFLSNFGIEFNTKKVDNIYELIPIKKVTDFNIKDYELPNLDEEILDIDTFEIKPINNKF